MRRPSKMDTFRAGTEHPTRKNPQTRKLVTANISFMKSLSRVILNHGSLPKKSSKEVIAKVQKIMPFMVNHLRKVRPDIDTARHLRKEFLDALCARKDTMKRYCPPYPNPRLIARKKAEVLLAVKLLRMNCYINEDFIKNTLGPLRDDL